MKLALVRRQFAATGGAELYLQRLLEALAAAGHQVHLFAQSWDQPPPEVRFHPVAVDRSSRAHRATGFARAVDAALSGESFDCVFSLERTWRQDVYRAGDGVHRVWLEQRRRYAPWWRRPFIGLGAFHRNMLALEARTFDPRNTRHIIVNSNRVKDEIGAHFAFPPERIHLVRNGVAVERFQNARRLEARARFGLGKNDFVLLFVGSGQERKGLRHVIRAAAAVDEVRESAAEITESAVGNLLLTGMDWQVHIPRQQVPQQPVKLLVAGKVARPAGSPPNVLYTGPVADIEAVYAAADLFLFLPIYEPSSNVVYEALAAGLPVITTACNGAAEVIEPRVNGSVVDSPRDLSAVLVEVLHWLGARRFHLPTTDLHALSLERNVAETLGVLELAAREKGAA